MIEQITFVYCAVNIVNGHKYIGVTYDFARRQREHYYSGHRPQTSFARAIRKYGLQAFEFTILSTWATRDQALAAEITLIAEQKPEYNMTSGGEGAPVLTRRRAVIRLSDGYHYETVTSAAKANGLSCMRIVQICQGSGVTKDGIPFMYADRSGPPKSLRKTPEQMLEVRKMVLVGAAKGPKTQSKPVICVNEGRRFPSISEAARYYGKHLASVADAIHRNGRAGGLKFEFARAA